MNGHNVIKILFILCTLVAQNLSFAGPITRETHIEYNAKDWTSGQGYNLSVVETHIIDSRWQIELFRLERTKPDGITQRSLRALGDFFSAALGAEENIRVYYIVRVQMIPSDEDAWGPSAVHVDFDYFVSGAPPITKNLKSVGLKTYAYFNEVATSLSLLTPTLQKIVVTPDERSPRVKVKPTLASIR